METAKEILNDPWTPIALGLSISIPLILSTPRWIRRMQRASKLPPAYERVLVIGASSGIGRAVAHLYASRGARVCVVARREAELQNVMEECRASSIKGGHSEFQAGGRRIIGVTADFTNVDDMVRVRTELETGMRFMSITL
jgi:NADPH:quinone reductase-like Zn-dependent oxidoreductase